MFRVVSVYYGSHWAGGYEYATKDIWILFACLKCKVFSKYIKTVKYTLKLYTKELLVVNNEVLFRLKSEVWPRIATALKFYLRELCLSL